MPRTEIDRIYILPSGITEVRIKKWNDEGGFRYHRTTIEPGVDPEKQMAEVNAHIRRTMESEWYVAQHGRHAEVPKNEIAMLKDSILHAHHSI